MLSAAENDLLTCTGPGTPMGDAMRRYWIPALLSWEIAEADCPPVQVKLLGEPLREESQRATKTLSEVHAASDALKRRSVGDINPDSTIDSAAAAERGAILES